MAHVEFKRVSKHFGPVEVIHGIDLSIADGEFVVFVGPSGCGKSTMLRLLCGLEAVSAGEIRIDGANMRGVDPARRGVAMVFQSYALYPHMTVRQNMGFSLRMSGIPARERNRRVDAAARVLRLEALLDRGPRELSGGQRQRVAIGRAIVREPKVFLFDEPLSNLDAELRVQMRQELANLHRQLGATMVFVTHDQVEAMTLANRIVVMRDGRVEQVGTPLDIFDAPGNRFVAGFIGSPRMNFLAGRIVRRQGSTITVAVPGMTPEVLTLNVDDRSLQQNDPVTLGIRPEHFVAADAGAARLEATIAFTEQLGSIGYLFAPDHPAGPLIVQAEGHAARHQPQEAIRIGIDPALCHLFRQDDQAVRVLRAP